MDALVGLLQDPVVLSVVQLLVGLAVKRWSSLAAVPNKLIPLLNFLLAVLIKIGGPATAGASVLGDLGRASPILLQAAVQTILTTGLHSVAKNYWQHLSESLVKRAASAASPTP